MTASFPGKMFRSPIEIGFSNTEAIAGRTQRQLRGLPQPFAEKAKLDYSWNRGCSEENHEAIAGAR